VRCGECGLSAKLVPSAEKTPKRRGPLTSCIGAFLRPHPGCRTPVARDSIYPQPNPQIITMDSFGGAPGGGDSKTQIMRQVQQEAAMQNARMLVEVALRPRIHPCL
jgi:hypothetical protein